MSVTQDLLPTIVALAGGTLPSDRTFDGLDMAPVLWKQAPSLHQALFFSVGGEVYNTHLPGQHARNPVPEALFEAVRTERWSAMYKVGLTRVVARCGWWRGVGGGEVWVVARCGW